MLKKIVIKGAKEHNLKNISLEIPKDKFIVITGLSGSGKSSLAFDTIYAEGQRRYVESLSAYARQFLELMQKPKVEHIGGLSPAIAINQKSVSHNPRSTVSTVTEINDYLRLLYARVGSPRCPDHLVNLEAMSISDMTDKLLHGYLDKKLMILSPIVKNQKGEHIKLIESFSNQGYRRIRINDEIVDISDVSKHLLNHIKRISYINPYFPSLSLKRYY